MSKLTIGVVDYGVGNHMSVRQSLHEIGLRCRVSSDPAILGACGLLLLPGVGAFRPAIEAVRERNLDEFLAQQVTHGVPVLGICLGMQLLADVSDEDGSTAGLGLIPGRVVSLPAPRWHTGWNTIEQVTDDPLFGSSHGQAFFFNHSYAYQCADEYQVCRTIASKPFTSAVRWKNVVGVQFHPEKSQHAGHALLREVVEGLCHA